MHSFISIGWVLFAILLTACNGDSGSITSDGANPFLATTTNDPGGTATIGGLPAIPSEFDYHLGLTPAWGTGAIPPSAAASNPPDVVGAFRFLCGAGQILPDDPIVYPGQPGRSHLHQFYGNVNANAYSNYQTLRTSGQSTCSGGNEYPLNRSAYWVPAMLDGQGHVVRPDWAAVYYKRMPQNSPYLNPSNSQYRNATAVAIPNGLRFIFGFNMSNPAATTTGHYWNCTGPTGVQGNYATITEAMQHCPTTPTMQNGVPVYNQLLAELDAPDCWDGHDLDSSDHRSHLAYASYGSWGYLKCPTGYQYLIPQFHLAVAYSVDSNLGTWHLSSDEMFPGTAPGNTLHADFFDAWDDTAVQMWTFHGCIDGLLNCSGADFGNGFQILGEGNAPADYYNGVFTHAWTNPNRLVPAP